MRRRGIIGLALEENSEGVTEIERERTFYAILSPDVAKLATVYEDQEQWHCLLPQAKDGAKARVRVRRTADHTGSVVYTQTLKIAMPGSKPGDTMVEETQLETTENFFTQFKRVAVDGMIKRRIFIKSKGGQELQVDAFLKSDGTYNERVKIDYEFSGSMPDTPEFPDLFTDIVVGDTKDPAEISKIKGWYATVFTVKNT